MTLRAMPGYFQAETTVEDARGASVIVWAVRAARMFNLMTPEEPEKLGIAEDERPLHVRVANGKANMVRSARRPGSNWMPKTRQRERNSVRQSMEAPGPLPGRRPIDMRKCCTLTQTGAYDLDGRSRDWVGYIVADVLKIN